MAEGSNGRRRFSDKWGKHELDVLAVLSSAFPQWLTSRQIAQRVKAYADSYGELADQAAKAAFAKQFQRDRAKLAAMGIAIESRQPEYSSKSEGQDFASYRLQLGDEPRIRLRFEQEDLPVLAAANYLARSISVSSTQSQTVTPQHVSRTTPRVPQTPIPGLGLDSIAPGLGTQTIPPALVRVVDSRRFAATPEPEDADPKKNHQKKSGTSFQTGSEVDRRLRLMLFLSAHLGEEFSLAELAERFIGRPKSDDELKKYVNVIHKDINTLTTVSDDGEMAGSQFFDIDWSLLDAEGIVSATNSLGLERLAGISPQYLSMLTASVSYLAHSPLLPEAQRTQAASLYQRLRQLVKPGETPWLSLTGYELEPHCFSVVKRAISTESLLDMEYTDGAGRTRRKVVAPSKIFVDEGVYYAAVWTDVLDSTPEDRRKFVSRDQLINKANGKPRTWQVLRLARIEHAEVIAPVKRVDIPDMPVSELRKWSFDNGTPAVFITDQPDLPFIKSMPGATVEPCSPGEKVHIIVSSDSWFVAFCIAHARHITAVAPETLRTMIVARAQRELSLGTREEDTPEEE